MLDTESVSRAFLRFSGPKLLGVLHKAENDIYERLGEITMGDDAERAAELADDVDRLVVAISVHLGIAAGRTGSSLRGSVTVSETSHSVSTPTTPTSNCSFSSYTVSELMSILASLFSVLLDITIGFSRNETDCANKLRVLVQRILTTFSPSYNIPRYSASSSPDASPPAKPPICADIRLLDVIAQAERITSLRNTATLLPLFDFALLSVKRLFSNAQYGNSKKVNQQPEQQEDTWNCNDSVAVMLKAIVVVRIAKRTFSRHALRHLRALHTSNGAAFPHVSIPLQTAISGSPYASELPVSAHASVDELRTFLLDHTSCSDELMERILFYLTRSSLSETPVEEEMDIEQRQDSSAENDFLIEKSVLDHLAEASKEEVTELPEKRRRVSSRGTPVGDTALFSIDRLRNGDVQQKQEEQQQTPELPEIDAETDEDNDSGELIVVDDSDLIEPNAEGEDDGDDDDNIPLDQLRHRRPKSVDSTMSASWASVSFEPGSDPGLAESSTTASPCSNSTANGNTTTNNSGNDATDAASTGNRRRSARLSSKNTAAKANGSGATSSTQ